MAKRRCGPPLVGLASVLISTAHGVGPLQRVPPSAEMAGLMDDRCSQRPCVPGPALNEADAAGNAAGDLSIHLLQARHGGLHVGWQADEVSYGNWAQAPRLPDGKGATPLRFLHIPRTGGTSIEMANMLLPAGHQAFASLFHDTVSCLQASMYPGSSLAAIYETTHEMSHAADYSQLMMSNECYHFISIGTWTTRNSCVEYHYPVRHSTLLQEFHQQGPTFCAVREPLQRFMSAFKVIAANTFGSSKGVNCTAPAYDEAITKLISEELLRQPFQETCFFVPQAEFIQGREPYCHHVLHTETLEDDFNTLMRSYGQNVTLPPRRYGDDWTETCNIRVANLSNSTRQLLYEFYKEDYDLLGYPRPL